MLPSQSQLRFPKKIEKAKANGVQHAFVSDVQHLLIPEPSSWMEGVKFDAVFSNASLHWCKQNPAGVLESAKGVLKCGGRFVGEMGGFMNCVGEFRRIAVGKPFVHDCSGIRSTLHAVLRRRGYDPVALDPWYFPSVASYRKVCPSRLRQPPTALTCLCCHRFYWRQASNRATSRSIHV
jgi:SAM-dependent methyltransferase